MALTLDLRLTRRGDEAWGFRLIGGVDFKMPLTVVKVQSATPALVAGLRNGDALMAIDGRRADALTHDEAYDVIKACDGELELEVMRGRYDPVLDDQEPLYDLIDQTDDELVDFVPLSDPSEVFMTIPDLSREPSTNPEASRGASDVDPSRSMTASPFVLPSKPYRPFSTEPIPEVPPLEDPIVLNPNYHDEFGHADDEDFLPKSKFKLPISEQYNPGNEMTKMLKKDSSMRIDLGKKETEMKEDLMFMKQMRQDIDLERIEKSVATVTELTNVAVAASNVVEESLFKAVTVAEEIKKEIDVELTCFESSEVKSSKAELQAKSTSDKSEFTSSVVESSDVQQSTKAREETIEDIIKENSERTKMEVAQSCETKTDESVSIKEERRVSLAKRDVEETIVAGTVKRLSNNFDKEVVKSVATGVEIKAETTTAKDTKTKESAMKQDKTIAQKDIESRVMNKELNKETTNTSQKSAMSESKSQKTAKQQTKTKYSTERLLAEQRAYTIGLQTIPNIRGKVHSSYHYDLLLKTFFIHLTDVMVALSRFILAENVLSTESGQTTEEEREVQKEDIVEQQVVSTEDYSVKEEETVQQEHIEEKQDVTVQAQEENEQVIDDHELVEKRKISGAKMAQMSSHKSEELTEKMEAVINEFQTKSGIEESSEQKALSLRERRSRSKSKVEKEVSKESDPLEWLSKKEEAREVISETVQACKAVEEVTQSEICVTESKKESSKVEQVTTTEKRQDRRSKSKDRSTYIAIVESHVYTNKDAILEEHLSGGSSVQNSAEIKETTENIFLGNAQFSKSVEETKQVTKEQVAMETAAVNVEETKKLLLEEARKASITEVSKQHVTKIEKEVEISKVEKLAEVTQKIDEPEPTVEEVEEKVVLNINPADIIQEDVQATVQILKEIPVSPEIIEISEETAMMVGTRHESSLHSEIATAKFESKTQEVHQTQCSDVNKQTHQLSLELKQEGYKISHSDSFPSTIDTPTPATVPPTPLTDEYVFRLEIPLPKTAGLPPVEEPEPSPEKESDHEDLNIVKKKWEIDSPTIQALVYDPPLPTPLEVKDAPKFSNAVLSEANDGSMSKEEILEIGRKSSLLASAIDETIKCIEEYKEQVGMETRRSISEETKKKDLKMEEIPLGTQPMYSGIVAEAKTTVYADTAGKTSEDAEKHKENWSKVTEQFKNNGKAAVIISKTSESTAKDSYARNSTDIMTKDDKSSYVAQTIDTSTKPVENVATTTDAIKETFSAKSAVEQNNDVLTSSIVSQNTDAVNKLSEYSSSITDYLTKDTFDSKTTSTESQNVLSSSYEAQNLDRSVLTSSIAADTVRESEKSIDELAKITQSLITQTKEVKTDPLQKIRSVPFNPEELKQRAASGEEAVNGFRSVQLNVASYTQGRQLATPRNVVVDGEVLATHQGIISGVEDVIIDEETAKELGKPGLTEERIAEIMSGESEMLREAHVMGLSRVIASHMTRVDENDSSVDFKKIKPTIDKLKDSEVLKALNDELTKTKEEIKKEERKWTTFLQKPDRPQPQAKFGYHGWLPQFIPPQEQYKVKIVKQPKPKVAPDYKPENFETGLLPWELRAANEPPPPPVDPEEPILIPEDGPEFYEAVDPLPESEVPDLEETGIPLPPEKVPAPEPEPILEGPEVEICPENIEQLIEEPQEPPVEEDNEVMEQNRLAEQLLNNVQSMVDPNATLEQQLAQMRAQLAALAQLPGVIQQSLELVTRQLMQITQQESTKVVTQSETVQETVEQNEATTDINATETAQKTAEVTEDTQVEASMQEHTTQEIQQQSRAPEATPEEIERMRREEQEILEEQRRVEKQKKELMEQIQLEQESRQLKQRPTPRVGRPKPAFGPLVPAERPLVLPGGRKWRKPKDAYNEQFIAETLTAQAEIIQGKTKGLSYESVLLPYDGRINFMKYEKPPVSLDHLKDSDVYKMIHNMEQVPMRRVDMLTPVVAECDYREKCRSITPCRMAHSQGEHLDMPEQVAP